MEKVVKMQEKDYIKAIDVDKISEETIQMIHYIVTESYEGHHLGLAHEVVLECVAEGYEVSVDLVKSNVFTYGQFNKKYLEDVDDSEVEMRIKDGLNKEDNINALKQLDEYKQELAFMEMVNYKIKTIHKLLQEGVLS